MTASAETGSSKIIHTDPTKDFFVKMITRDIDLQDCIFDLLDNAIDGARRRPSEDPDKPFSGHFAKITFDQFHFKIEDNCGGIRLSDAIDYAFHFGRRPDSPADVTGGIGLYGIGMKRAIFKIGNVVEVFSDADDACFTVSVNVPEWEKQLGWDFEYEDAATRGTKGTTISVSGLNPGIDSAFEDPIFINELIRLVARDYAFFIAKGFQIHVGSQLIPSYRYQLRSNSNLAPASISYVDDGVNIRIVAGLIDELSDEIPETLTPKDVERYGWYIICNDRVVLAANKTDRTIWGDDGFKIWHPQYNGFAGFVFFHADDQRVLPWTTTKREVDASSPLYRRTLKQLKILTEQFIAYTNRRKEDLTAAKEAEKPSEQIDVYTTSTPSPQVSELKLPTFSTSHQPTDPLVNITYKRKESELNEIRSHLNRRSMSNKDIGVLTFEHYREVELGK